MEWKDTVEEKNQHGLRVNGGVRKLTTMGMMAAVSIILVYLIHFPIFPMADFLEYDPADIPIFICTFVYGPVSGLVLTVLAAGIQAVTVSAKSGLYGFLMHVIATGTFVLVAGSIYRRGKSKKRAILALALGTLAMAAIMAPANLFITPIFMGAPVEAVRGMLLPIIIPFNFLKAGINSVITFFLYKRVARFIPHGE